MKTQKTTTDRRLEEPDALDQLDLNDKIPSITAKLKENAKSSVSKIIKQSDVIIMMRGGKFRPLNHNDIQLPTVRTKQHESNSRQMQAIMSQQDKIQRPKYAEKPEKQKDATVVTRVYN